MRGARKTTALLTLVLLFSHALITVKAGKSYYDILNIPRGADEAQIKRAYRKLAVQYHPDKVSGSAEEKEAAAKKYTDISTAYQALSDPEKRRIYDRYGEEGLKDHDRGNGGGGGGAHDIFSQFFGGFGGFGFGGPEDEEEPIARGNDVVLNLPVTLKQLYLGASLTVHRDKHVIKPAKGKRQCKCKNKVVTRQLGPGMFQQYTTTECEECPNEKYVREDSKIHLTIEPGAPDKHVITFFEEGEPQIDGEPGDLRLILRTKPDKRFVRQGNDLWIWQNITLEDALIGFSKQVKHLDGHMVKLDVKGVTKPKSVMTIEGEGMPIFEDGHRNGNLYVQYDVMFPSKLSEKQKSLVKQMNMEHDEL